MNFTKFDVLFTYLIWGFIGLIAGIASFLNMIMTNPQYEYTFWKMMARGFIGLVVGFVFASFMSHIAPNLSIPSASVGGWFATETMSYLQAKITQKK